MAICAGTRAQARTQAQAAGPGAAGGRRVRAGAGAGAGAGGRRQAPGRAAGLLPAEAVVADAEVERREDAERGPAAANPWAPAPAPALSPAPGGDVGHTRVASTWGPRGVRPPRPAQAAGTCPCSPGRPAPSFVWGLPGRPLLGTPRPRPPHLAAARARPRGRGGHGAARSPPPAAPRSFPFRGCRRRGAPGAAAGVRGGGGGTAAPRGHIRRSRPRGAPPARPPREAAARQPRPRPPPALSHRPRGWNNGRGARARSSPYLVKEAADWAAEQRGAAAGGAPAPGSPRPRRPGRAPGRTRSTRRTRGRPAPGFGGFTVTVLHLVVSPVPAMAEKIGAGAGATWQLPEILDDF
ncbi:translation initiation factor IF-2-like [Vulpes lagopus]|uniref:translation initiation factor IF-2-like n=1 Tax=Vulpes lagopus TaxID=494514 RepID=UPI001BC95734|nr:translation initiation factor IF-2-like [Vulpes lagopus]